MKLGTRLCHFELLEPLGAGGMGEVYRAQDTNLRREVAIKLLPAALSSDPERLARLQREAHLLAALNHPNVAAIHSLEQDADIRFLVMELVEGETLAEHLQRGPLPVELALRIAGDIAQALEAAHAAGIIHRDLKPANIKLTPDVKVKVLDFGLAKATDPGPSTSSTDLSRSPTLMGGLTGTGVILGTAAYMSPEQARGQPLDRQTDIWSFGCVLYEMLAGTKPFGRETLTDTLAAILDREADLEALPSSTPILIRSLVPRCLRKDPGQRLHDIADARIEIEDVLREPEGAPPSPAQVDAPPRRWQRALPWSLVAVMVTVVSVVFLWAWRQPSTPLALSRIPVELPFGMELAAALPAGVAVSADGRRLAFVARQRGETRRLYVKEISDLEPTEEVPGTDSASQPFFSPDGDWLGFFQGDDLMKVAIGGGVPQLLHGGPGGVITVGGAWGPDHTILFTRSYASGIWRVSDQGGEATQITAPDLSQGETTHAWPVFLPGGKEALFTKMFVDNQARSEIVKINLETGERAVVQGDAFYPRYSPTGHLVYGQPESILAVPFDLERGQVTGTPGVVLEDVRTTLENNAMLAFSDTGVLAYVSSPGSSEPSYLLVDREGRVQRRFPEMSGFGAQFAPGSQKVVYSSLRDDQDIWVYDLERGDSERLTTDPNWDGYAVVSSDGNVAFATQRGRGGNWSIFMKPMDGGEAVPLVVNEYKNLPTSWSHDGRLLAYQEQRSDSPYDIWIYDLDDPENPTEFIASKFEEGGAVFSPDGRWLAYTSDENGVLDIYVVPYPERTPRYKVTTGGVGVLRWSAVWAPNGREIFYVTPGIPHRPMAVSVETEPEFGVVGEPRLLFRTGVASPEIHPGSVWYEVAPDGEHFIVPAANESEPLRLHIVLNWFEQLKELVPTGR